MAVTFSSALFLLLVLYSSTTFSAVTFSTHEELDTALRSLRSHGYRLFTNAITTSEIKFLLLSPTTTTTDSAAPKFTMFAPRDDPIYDLDMTADASDYISTLRYHVIPNRRLTYSDLQNLSSPFLPTLLPHSSILIGKIFEGDAQPAAGVMVDGARITDPDVFLGPNMAVHGISGILSRGFNLQHEDLIDDRQNGSGHFSPAGSPVPIEALSPMSAHSGLSNSPVAAPSVPPADPISRNVPVKTTPGGEQQNVAPADPVSQNVPVKTSPGDHKAKKKAPVKKSPADEQRNANRRQRRRGHGQAHSRRRHRQQPRNFEL